MTVNPEEALEPGPAQRPKLGPERQESEHCACSRTLQGLTTPAVPAFGGSEPKLPCIY